MRLIRLLEYEPSTMELARPIYDKYRRILLAEGRSIHPVYVNRLQALNLQYIFVEDAVSKGITMEEMIEMPTWIECIDSVEKAFLAAKNKQIFPVREIQITVKKLVDEVYNRSAIVLIPSTFLAEEMRLYAHSVNVALLSIQIGKQKGYNQLQLKDLAMGALLHDIGKVLTEDEPDHMTAGFEYLRKVREISLLAAHIAYQHHEHVDGSGKPRSVSGEKIHEYAQICSITNMFDNLTSIKGYSPSEAIEFIMTKNEKIFQTEIIKIFVQEVPLYPPGTKIRLNTDDEAIVVRINKNLQRPVIRLLKNGQEISLDNEPTLIIKEVIVAEAEPSNEQSKKLSSD